MIPDADPTGQMRNGYITDTND